MRLRALASAARSPLNSHVTEVFKGRTTFRAFGVVDWSLLKLARLQETSSMLNYNVQLLSVWFTARMNMIGSVAATLVAVYFGEHCAVLRSRHLLSCLSSVLGSHSVGSAGLILVLVMELFVSNRYFCSPKIY